MEKRRVGLGFTGLGDALILNAVMNSNGPRDTHHTTVERHYVQQAAPVAAPVRRGYTAP